MRLCAYCTGDCEAADDMAQEALLIAWQQVERLRDPAALSSWLSGIAPNLSLRRLRWLGREPAHRTVPREDGDPVLDIASTIDVDAELERVDLLTLLKRAMALLPEATRHVLVQKFVEASTHRELAQQMGMSEQNVGVRAHRGTATLRSLLATDLRAALEPCGLLSGEDSWQQTRLWCTSCGQVRLLGRLNDHGFALRCPSCNLEPGSFHAYSRGARSTARGCKTFRPAYKRFAQWMNEHMQRAVRDSVIGCPSCGRVLPLHREMPDYAPPTVRSQRGLHFYCDACDNGAYDSLEGLALGLPEGQAFLQANPRIRACPQREIERDGVTAWVVSFESVMSRATFDVDVAQDSYRTLALLGDIGSRHA